MQASLPRPVPWHLAIIEGFEEIAFPVIESLYLLIYMALPTSQAPIQTDIQTDPPTSASKKRMLEEYEYDL